MSTAFLPSLHPWRTGGIFLLGLLGALAAGCSGLTAVEESEVRQAFGIPATMPMKDLGAIELRTGIPKRVRVDRCLDCIITATRLTNDCVRLNLQCEVSGTQCDRGKRAVHSEQKQLVFRPDTVPAGWRLCAGPFGDGLVLAIQPIILP